MTAGGEGGREWLFPVEVGCREFPAQSVWRMLTAIGLDRVGEELRKTAVCRMREAAEKKTSCWLWSRGEEFCWKPGGEDGQELGHHCRPTIGRVLWLRVEISEERWVNEDRKHFRNVILV